MYIRLPQLAPRLAEARTLSVKIRIALLLLRKESNSLAQYLFYNLIMAECF